MSQPWHDLAEKSIDPDDKIEKTYECSFDKQNGYLCLGRKKMVFVGVKGFLKKSYNLLLDASYTDVKEVRLANRFKIDLLYKDKTHSIETSDVSAKVVIQGIENVTKSSPLQPHIVFSGL
ncbi:hypothetical protein E4H04_01260 [Candidatus Bathyarchaeota archaeon]|nr:MAG: hypothetical protein E4H04_01260 [Candidatus Bathyarchaeota archaeon]